MKNARNVIVARMRNTKVIENYVDMVSGVLKREN